MGIEEGGREGRGEWGEVGEAGGGDGVSVLTVGDTLVLDFQVLVGPWAGVREDI